CQVGFYCPSETTSRSMMISTYVCPAGLHCPTGSDRSPDLCPNGTFNPNTGRKHVSECQKCWKGYYCEPEGREGVSGPCPPGYYCEEGTGYKYTYPCPIGFYRNASAAISVQDCSVCSSGFYCDDRGLSVPKTCTTVSLLCDINFTTSRNPLQVFTGYDYGGVCPPGYYCLKGTREATQYPCPNGTYNDQWGRVQMSECLACPGGKACTGVGLKYWTGVCRAGHYCKGGSTTPTPDDGVTGNVCPIGKHCPTGSSEPKDCAPGTFRQNTKLRKEQDCWPCKGGKYCEGHGAKEFPSSNSGDCAAGFYCVQGVNTPRPSTNFSGIGGVCPPGAYCPLGTAEPIGCPNGTFSNVSQLESAGDCTLCSDGMYCEQSNLTSPTGG
ncbi:predicted protein, partial [Nematostella vectensis]